MSKTEIIERFLAVSELYLRLTERSIQEPESSA